MQKEKFTLKFHPNLKKILIATNNEHVFEKFKDLRQRIYQIEDIAMDKYPKIIKKHLEEIDKISTINGKKPVFLYQNFQAPAEIMNLVESFHNNVRQMIELFLKILNNLHKNLGKKKDTKPKPINVTFKEFIKAVKNDEYKDYRSPIITFLLENFDHLCLVRWLRNQFKNNSNRNLIFRSDKGFVMVIPGNIKKMGGAQHLDIKKINKDGSFFCTIDLDHIMKVHTKWYIEAYKVFVNNLAKELNDQLTKEKQV